MKTTIAIVSVFLFIGTIFAATTPRSEAQITSLPGLTFTPNFDQYSGYIQLNGTTKNIFYWFFTSQNSPSTDPVVLWLQGGPGCSDLGDGLFLEHGPYYPNVVDYDTQEVNLVSNYYSWNRVANMIYIDSPCGVGFSYGEKISDYHSSDNITAVDTYMFLQQFFEIYNEFSQNVFWICGESYGGVYITTLAYQVLNNGSDSQLAANLKKGGLMLGNPVTDCAGESYTGKGGVLNLDLQVNLYYWHGMVSRDNFDTWNSEGCNTEVPPSLTKCYELYDTIERGTGVLDQPTRHEQQHIESRQPVAAINPDMLYYSFCTGNGTLDFNVDLVPNCYSLDDQIVTYLNTPDVQQAIHAKSKTWQECGGVFYTKDVGSVIPYLENFFSVAPGMRIMYYAGDVDIATVPFAQTQRCLETMNRPIVDAWRPYTVNKEVAGYVEVYDTYTFATIKGAGHEAPQYQPTAGYLLFTSFLQNTELPK